VGVEQHLNPTANIERREAPWQNVEVLMLVTRERHQAQERNKLLARDSIIAQGYVQLMQDLLARADLNISPKQRKAFESVTAQLRIYQSYLRQHLRPEPPIEPGLQSTTPPEAKQQLINLYEPEDSLVHEANVQRVSNALENSDRSELFSLSDSHTTTAYILQALREEGVPLQQVGLLTFDHHTDLRPISGTAKKDSVVTHAVQTLGVGGVIIAGYESQFAAPEELGNRRQRIERLPAHHYYADERPNRAAFLSDLEPIFDQWKQQGVTSVYTSVDLDGLRLPEQLYTATDYNPLDQIRRLLDAPENSMLLERLRAGGASLSTKQAQETLGWLYSVLQHNQLTDYRGVPASWVIQAQRLAHEQFGLQLGIQRPGTEQRVIGDVVEFTPPDYQNRTARIAKALLGGMAKAAQ
jgi:arginase family enzyme